MSQGAPAGNQNAKKGKAWADAIRRAIREKYDGEDYEAKLAKLAKKLVDAADGGDLQALREIGDRHDGKPAQALVGDDDAPPIKVASRIELVDLGSGTGSSTS